MSDWLPFHLKRKSPPLELLLAPAGSTVLLRTSMPLTAHQRGQLWAELSKPSEDSRVNFVLLSGAEWDARVTGAEAVRETFYSSMVANGRSEALPPRCSSAHRAAVAIAGFLLDSLSMVLLAKAWWLWV